MRVWAGREQVNPAYRAMVRVTEGKIVAPQIVLPTRVCHRRAPAWDHRRGRSIWRRCGTGILRAARREKGRMLTEAVTVTGYHRKAIIRAWQRPAARRARGPRRGRCQAL